MENIWEFPLAFKTISSLPQFSKPLRDFLILVLVCNKISPRYGNDKNKVSFSTVATWGRSMKTLLRNVLNNKWINK